MVQAVWHSKIRRSMDHAPMLKGGTILNEFSGGEELPESVASCSAGANCGPSTELVSEVINPEGPDHTNSDII